MTQTKDQIRVDFESWAKANRFNRLTRCPLDQEKYSQSKMQWMWEAWQAAQVKTVIDAAQITREFDELLGDYWDEAYEQGEDGRTYDTNGTAQRILSNLQELFTLALQAQAKREPMSEIGLANQTAKFYPPDEALASAIYMQAWRDAEAHHNIGDKA